MHVAILRVVAVDVCRCIRKFVDHSNEGGEVGATGDVANPFGSDGGHEGRHICGAEFVDCCHLVDSAGQRRSEAAVKYRCLVSSVDRPEQNHYEGMISEVNEVNLLN